MIDVRALLSNSWAKYTAQAGQCIAIVLVGGLLIALGMLTLGIISMVIGAGLIKAFGKAEQGGSLDLNDLFSEFSNFSNWIVAWALVFIPLIVIFGISWIPVVGPVLASLLGLVFCILVFFMVQLMLAKNQSALDAFSGSIQYVTSHLDKLIVPFLVILLFEGTLVFLVINLISSLPVVGVLFAVMLFPLSSLVGLAALLVGIPWMLFARWRLFRQLFP